MATIQHPGSLNVLQQYRQACLILRNTTRASNPAWYQSALDLGYQLHIRSDGPTVFSAFFDRKTSLWTEGPQLSDEILHDASLLKPILSKVLQTARNRGASSLGVILHIADEFATTELKPELNNPASLPELRNLAIQDPASIVEDSSILADQASWRVLPYPAAGSEVIGTTITVTQQYATLFSALRSAGERANFPIITHALSAPLVAVMSLGQRLTQPIEKPFVAILQYPWFTVLAFFNEHADLRLIRTLQHRGMRKASNFRNALYTTSISLEFLDPDLYILPLGRDIDTSLEISLRANFANCKIEIVRPPVIDGIPEWAPELSTIANSAPANSSDTSHTFTILREEGWGFQDFMPTPREAVETYPTKSEMTLLRLTGIVRIGLIAATLLCFGYFAYGVAHLMQLPDWSFNPADASIVQAKLLMLSSKQKSIQYWECMLDDRSKAWANMEFLSRTIPENKGLLINQHSYSVKTEASAGKEKVGFTKSWKITGFARDEALQYLNTLNSRDGIHAHFTKIARITGNSAFDPNIGNRSITINIRTQENRSFKPQPSDLVDNSDDTSYPFTFDLTLTQCFEATDPLAINATKAP